MKFRSFISYFFAVLAIIGLLDIAQARHLKEHHVTHYTVQPGDTMWKIANQFLDEPWLWHSIWQANQHIGDPDRLFPGDVLTLEMHNGLPRLRVGHNVVKLSPKIRTEVYEERVPAIPPEVLRPFLNYDMVFDEDILSHAPYVLTAQKERMSGSRDSLIYIRGITDNKDKEFAIYRPSKPIKAYEEDEVLGYLGEYVGSGEIIRAGDPATMSVYFAKHEILKGDRLLPLHDLAFDPIYELQPFEHPVNARILQVMGGLSQIGEHQVVLIDCGRNVGFQSGDILTVYQWGGFVNDMVTGRAQRVEMPDEPAGEMMVLRVFEKLSFGLILNSKTSLHVGDFARPPHYTDLALSMK